MNHDGLLKNIHMTLVWCLKVLENYHPFDSDFMGVDYRLDAGAGGPHDRIGHDALPDYVFDSGDITAAQLVLWMPSLVY